MTTAWEAHLEQSFGMRSSEPLGERSRATLSRGQGRTGYSGYANGQQGDWRSFVLETEVVPPHQRTWQRGNADQEQRPFQYTPPHAVEPSRSPPLVLPPYGTHSHKARPHHPTSPLA